MEAGSFASTTTTTTTASPVPLSVAAPFPPTVAPPSTHYAAASTSPTTSPAVPVNLTSSTTTSSTSSISTTPSTSSTPLRDLSVPTPLQNKAPQAYSAPQPHKKIAWAGHSGVAGAIYCCVCSYSTRDKTTVPCEEEGCPNSVCSDCYSGVSFSCTNTAQLRKARGIDKPVIREPVPDPISDNQEHPSITQSYPSAAPVNLTTEEQEARSELISTPPETLADIILSLRRELYTVKAENREFKKQKERVITSRQHLTQALSALDSLGGVTLSSDTPPVTQSTSALPSKIDADWREVCSSDVEWNQWWNSGRPKPLRKVSYEGGSGHPSPAERPHPVTATLPVAPPPRPVNPTRPTPPPGISADIPGPPLSRNRRNSDTPPRRRQGHGSDRRGADSTGPNRRGSNSGGGGGRGNHENRRRRRSSSNNNRRRRFSPERPHCGTCLQRGHTRVNCTAIVCDFCGRRGHRADICRTRQAEERRTLRCEYCLRRGHDEENCSFRAADNRQERLLRALLSERQPPPPPPVSLPAPPAPPLLPAPPPGAAPHHHQPHPQAPHQIPPSLLPWAHPGGAASPYVH